MDIKGKVNNNNKTSKVRSKINKDTKIKKNKLIIGLLVIIDIILIICFAKNNYANYATIEGQTIFVGETKNLLFGRNYIGLLVSLFIFGYWVLINKCYFKNKFNLKKMLIIFVSLLIFNMLLFYLFINKIY